MEKGREFALFKEGKIEKVQSACLRQGKRILYLLNEEGRLFEVDMNTSESLQSEIARP